MQVAKHQEIVAPFAWKGADLQHRTNWIRPFAPAELAEMDAAVQFALDSPFPEPEAAARADYVYA